jgi:hypothetical protein
MVSLALPFDKALLSAVEGLRANGSDIVIVVSLSNHKALLNTVRE